MIFDRLEVTVENAAWLSQHDKIKFCEIRRQGIGGSESSVVLGINPWKTVDVLIQEKLQKHITQQEIKVGEQPNVRKGADLEPLILKKFEEWSGFTTVKPEEQYRFKEYPWLTVNFDGVIDLEGELVPVEAKLVSMYGEKHWNKATCIANPHNGRPLLSSGSNYSDCIKRTASAIGIPEYYYTQVQHQLLATGAKFGYLAALFDKDWTLRVYKVFADEKCQQALITESEKIWRKIEAQR